MVISVWSSIASTKPSPSVLSAARNARIFSVSGTRSCASGTTARVDTLALEQCTDDFDHLAACARRLATIDAELGESRDPGADTQIARWPEISSSVAIAIAVNAG